MIAPKSALARVLRTARDFGTESIDIGQSLGRILAEPLLADRDTPPFNRATMDGIAIKWSDYKRGIRSFSVRATQAAGDTPVQNLQTSDCVQIMTGAAVPNSADTIIPIEQVSISSERAVIRSGGDIAKGQFIHPKGADAGQGAVLVPNGQQLSSAIIPIAASIGKKSLLVRRAPKIVAISTGNELVDIGQKPSPYQIRRSNSYATRAVLAPYAVDILHLPDEPARMQQQLKGCLASYDAIILSGGVSKGVFDFLPSVMAELAVETMFHGVAQKPGKPLWFGQSPSGSVVFGLPGNPVSTYVCLHKYVLPWLQACLGFPPSAPHFAILDEDVTFQPKLHYFLQVSLRLSADATLHARPLPHNGSGDYASLTSADGFIELPANKQHFTKGESYPILATRSIL